MKKEYFADSQLRQADKEWIIVNYNQLRYRKSNSIINPVITKCEYIDNRTIAQAIYHPYKNLHPVFDQLDTLYEYLSKKSDKVLELDESFKDLIQIFLQHIWWFSQPGPFSKISWHFIKSGADFLPAPENLGPGPFSETSRHFINSGRDFSPAERLKGTATFLLSRRKQEVAGGSPTTVLLAFSGGKGSLATALFYKDQGTDVRLIHICGLNRSKQDEPEYARRQAEKLELPIYFYNIKVNDGYYDDYSNHPMRNIVIANAIIHFAYIHHLPPNVAFGTFGMDRLAYNHFDTCGGSCREMWDAYEKIVQRCISDFRVRTPLPHSGMAMDRLQKNSSYLDMTTSCATELQHRGILQRRVKKFFHIDIMKQNCGACWKCATDYIYRCDHDMEEPNYHYYIICMTILKAQFDGERGYPCFSIYDIWNRFFYYNIIESKFHEELRKARVLESGNISFPNHVVKDYYAFKSFKRVSSITYRAN